MLAYEESPHRQPPKPSQLLSKVAIHPWSISMTPLSKSSPRMHVGGSIQSHIRDQNTDRDGGWFPASLLLCFQVYPLSIRYKYF
jgi:hypothetical protein